MSQRIQSMHDGLAVIAATVGAAVAAVGALLGAAPAESGWPGGGTGTAAGPLTAFNGQAIYDDEHLRLISLVGALGGAVVNLWLFDSPLGVRFMARKVSCSTITGVVCTPIAVHWLGIVPNVDNLLAVSFLMAIVSVGLLRSLLPVWTRLVTAKLGVAVPDAPGSDSIALPPPASAPAPSPDHRPPAVP